MKIGILPVTFVLLVLSENMLLGAPTNRSGTSNTSSAKLVATSTAKSGKTVSLTTTPAKRSSLTTKKNAAIVSKGTTGKMTTTLKTTTQKKKGGFPAGKTTTKKFANLKDTPRTTKPSRTSPRSTIKTPFGTMEEPIIKPYPTSKKGGSNYRPAQPYIPELLFSAPFLTESSKDYENPYGNISITAIMFENVTSTEAYGNVTLFEQGNVTGAKFPLSLENGTYYGFTVGPETNSTQESTLTTTTRKRLKRKKTTVGADLTTRKRLKRKRTTTVAPSGTFEEYEYDEN